MSASGYWFLLVASNAGTAWVVWAGMRWYANRLPETLKAIAFAQALREISEEDKQWIRETTGSVTIKLPDPTTTASSTEDPSL